MSRAITRGKTIRTCRTSRAPTRAPSSIAATEISRRATLAPVAPASGPSAATPVIVSVSTVVVRSGTASLRAVPFCTPMAAASTTISAYRRPVGTGGAVSAAMITVAASRTAWTPAATPSSRSRLPVS